MIANNDGWIEWTWTEEKPYPETLDTIVEVLTKGGYKSYKDTVGWWHEATVTDSSWFQKGDLNEIVAYRVVN